MSANKFRLIEEVRKRPLLWNYKDATIHRNIKMCDEQWEKVGKTLNLDAITCKETWIKLRMQFCSEAYRISARIEKAKKAHTYDPLKKYYTWAYFDSLRFLRKGLSSKAKLDLSFDNNSDSDIEIVENTNSDKIDKIKTHFTESNPIQIESDNDIEIVESNNDIEIVESHNLDQAQCLQEKYIDTDFFRKKRKTKRRKRSPIIVEDDSDSSRPGETNFKPNTVATSSNSVVKQEPELQIETEKPALEYEGINELQDGSSSTLSAAEVSSNCSKNFNLLVVSHKNEYNELEEFISSPNGANNENNEHQIPSTFPDEHASNSPALNDEDYSFLYSFLSQTKVMTQLRKMEFRVNMKNLLLNIFPASASVNILEKQLLLPEDNDPDRKFLISFWPFLKSMSLTQNVQFRAKMADLVLRISSEPIF